MAREARSVECEDWNGAVGRRMRREWIGRRRRLLPTCRPSMVGEIDSNGFCTASRQCCNDNLVCIGRGCSGGRRLEAVNSRVSWMAGTPELLH